MALALNRQLLMQKLGHLVSFLRARLILGCFNNSASRIRLDSATCASRSSKGDDTINFVNQNQGGYRDSGVPGHKRAPYFRMKGDNFWETHNKALWKIYLAKGLVPVSFDI